MFNQRGQAFDVFKLLIAAVVAVVILTLLLSIINQLGGLNQSDPATKAGSLVRDLSTTKGTYNVTETVTFNKGKSISNISVSESTKGNLEPEEVCVYKGDFQNDTSWNATEPKSVTYNGFSPKRALVGAICDTGQRIGGGSYFSDYTNGQITEEMLSAGDDCKCISDDSPICCIVVLKKATT